MWYYNLGEITSIEGVPKDSYGFIYEIVNLTNGKKYIGCKVLFTKRKRRFGKREIAKMTDKRLKTWEWVIKESNWLDYTGSNKNLNADIKKGDKIEKKILAFARDKRNLSYLETKELFKHNVLESDNFYNDNILGKFYKAAT